MPKPNRNAVRAWLVRWEWVGAHAAVEDPVAAVLPYRWGTDSVARGVEALYAANEYEPAEMLNAARRPKDNPYRAVPGKIAVIQEDGANAWITWEGELLCGHNPHLVARQAHVWEVFDPPGSIAWEYLPRPPLLDLRGAQPPAWVLESLDPPL